MAGKGPVDAMEMQKLTDGEKGDEGQKSAAREEALKVKFCLVFVVFLSCSNYCIRFLFWII